MRRKVPQVFIDTNVWFSAFYGSANSERLLKAHVWGHIKAVISRQVLDELVRNVRAKIPQAERPLKTFLEATPPKILREPITIPPKLVGLVHPKDAPLVAAAIQAGLHFFVTGNKSHFDVGRLRQRFTITILTPNQLVDSLKL